MRKHLLFVTYQNENFDEGLSYAIDLALAMNEDLTILMTRKKSLMNKVEDIMAAVAFAQAGEHETTREILSDNLDAGYEKKLNLIMERCQNEGIVTRVYTAALDVMSAIEDFFKHKNNVDMVLLSPSITDNGNIKSGDLQKLVRTASRPVVTMARQIYAA